MIYIWKNALFVSILRLLNDILRVLPWVFSCWARFELSLKVLSQNLHSYGETSVWTRMWRASSWDSTKPLLHKLHFPEKEWVRLCFTCDVFFSLLFNNGALLFSIVPMNNGQNGSTTHSVRYSAYSRWHKCIYMALLLSITRSRNTVNIVSRLYPINFT